LTVVAIELDLPLAGYPDGPDAVKPELSAHVIASEDQQRFAEWLNSYQTEVLDCAMNEISDRLGARFHRGGGSVAM
jgi:hypothetical protein